LLSGPLAALTILPAAAPGDMRPASRVTILVDAFGKPSALKMDWGYSALVEHGGRRILFVSGNSAEVFAHNVKTLGVDHTRLDFVVISHRHGDHTDGLRHLLKVNPGVKVYAPNDEHFGEEVAERCDVSYRQGRRQLPLGTFSVRLRVHLHAGRPRHVGVIASRGLPRAVLRPGLGEATGRGACASDDFDAAKAARRLGVDVRTLLRQAARLGLGAGGRCGRGWRAEADRSAATDHHPGTARLLQARVAGGSRG
jgi:hypothetical protein